MDIFNKDQPFQFGEAVFPDGGRYGPIQHEHMDISFIIKGDVVCNIDERNVFIFRYFRAKLKSIIHYKLFLLIDSK